MEPSVPAKMMDGLEVEELDQADPQQVAHEEVQAFIGEFQNKDCWIVNGGPIT